jgi:hypothetical protein
MTVMVIVGVINVRRVSGVVAIDIRIAAKVLEYLGAGEPCDEGANQGRNTMA